MALKQFISSSIEFVPQAGMSIIYTENGGIEATQEILISQAKFATTTAFARGARWDSLFPQVPNIYRALTLKTRDPIDRGDGFYIVKCTFTGYEFSGSGSSGEEATIPTSTLSGQLEDVPLSQHPKWIALDVGQKFALGLLITGDAVAKPDFTSVGSYDDKGAFNAWEDSDGDPIVLDGDSLTFAKIIASGESTYRRGGWTYSYHTEGSTGFSGSQLASLGKIVNNPPGNPVDPGAGWTWMLTGPSQSQSGPDRFVKTLDFQLIRDNEANQFLY